MIHLEKVSRIYEVGNQVIHALDAIDLNIAAGEFVAIMGRSGSGKSTLLNMLGCMDRPDKGEYFLDKNKVSDMDDDELSAVRNRYMGFVFQSFHLLPLEDRAEHKPNELSGGQRQRVAIARALINDPKVLLADEPTGNLDSRTSDAIMALLRQLNENGQTIVMVTHEPDIADNAQRQIFMRDGKILQDYAV